MEAFEAAQLIKKYAECKVCGSEYIGNGSGTLEIEDNYFKRSCKCGWAVEIKDGIINEGR